MEFNYFSILNAVILGITSGMVGHVFINVLINQSENGIFDFYPSVMGKLLLGKSFERAGNPFLSKIYHVFVVCSKCASGQIALWTYLIAFQDKSLLTGVICVCVAILMAIKLKN